MYICLSEAIGSDISKKEYIFSILRQQYVYIAQKVTESNISTHFQLGQERRI